MKTTHQVQTLSPRVLCVDDDDNILRGLRRSLAELYDVTTSTSGSEALEILRTEPRYAVIISDMYMPEMNGAKFLAAAREISPDSTRILLSGQPDLKAAVDAVNEGRIFQLLQKPCPPKTLKTAVKWAAEQHQLVIGEKELLERTLSGSIGMLTELMAILGRGAPRRAVLARSVVREYAAAFGLQSAWGVETAVVATHLARVTIPPDLLPISSDGMTEHRVRAAGNQCIEVAERLLAAIPRLDPVFAVMREAHAVNAAADPVAMSTEAGLLLLLLDYDILREAHSNTWGAVKQLRSFEQRHPERLVDFLESKCLRVPSQEVVSLTLDELRPGMVAAQSISARTRELEIVPSGVRLTRPLIERLRNYARVMGVTEPIHVFGESLDDA